MDDDFEIIDIENSNKEGDVINHVSSNVAYKDLFFESLSSFTFDFLWFVMLLTFEEFTFHFWAFGNFSVNLLIKFLFCFPLGAMLALITGYFKGVCKRIVNIIETTLIVILFIVHILYYSVFKIFFSIEFLDKNNAKIIQYYREIIAAIKENIVVVLIAVLVPVIVSILFEIFSIHNKKNCDFKCLYIPFLFIIVSLGICSLPILILGKAEYSPYDLVFCENIPEYSFETLGCLATNEIQIKNLILPGQIYSDEEDFSVWVSEEKDFPVDLSNNDPSGNDISANDVSNNSVSENEPVKVIDTSPNVLDIDFFSLSETEENETYASIDRYIASLEPTKKNEYTGMFEGFNLIFMTAEGFSDIAVDETHTPTLYRLTHEGFVFNNFYNPRTGGSTSDGEFVNCTSLFPTFGGAKNFKIAGQNAMPFALGNLFNRTYGITSRAYHNNDYTYYGRDITYPGMGYYYEGVGNGVEVSKHWPESDLEMMQDTIPDYIDDDLFHVYYMTVSGHLNYSFSGNYYSKYHMEEVADLPYSEAGQAYIACQMEFDKALEYLIEQLEKKGIADRTVICFTGDHWPYGLDNNQFSEVLGHEVDEVFELYKSNLILWSEAIKEPIVIDKVCCSYDILPTLLNLFGFEYDSRLFVGRDILSDSEGFAPMWDKSIITDRFKYISKTKEVIPLVDEEITEDEINAAVKRRSNAYKYSNLIMDSDYYSFVSNMLGIEDTIPEQNYTVDYSKFVP